ncbi:hypothetical protein BD410DRAFT_811997 [Rickenella mellea]|uniref:Uncharacterized protein n=1 Tax=Rickenella mellea TaxID=50990 RepID=A0A4Y7QJI8_9AGAM|nr:hypothetical protein BD410DRAFT_811997 [Rickenella mellea]
MARATRSQTSPKNGKTVNAKKTGKGKKKEPVSDLEDSEPISSDDNASDAYEEPESVTEDHGEDDDVASIHSDALDDESDASPGKKRKRASPKKGTPKKKVSPKKRKTQDDEDEEVEEWEDGMEVVGTVVQAPTTGQVPPGRISKNTLKFLSHLKDPKCNDREWCALTSPPYQYQTLIPCQPVYRQAEKEWKAFIEVFTPILIEVDNEIPTLPPNDVVHRIYRDIRFSNDKTPYKTGFTASFSRGGRKGTFAHCAICSEIFTGLLSVTVCIVTPGGSYFAAGSWCPGRDAIQNIRTNIMRNPSRLREVISAPEFVKLFGEPKPHPKGERRNIFGFEDELKKAPKGVPKDHKDIDLLKCRTIAVSCRFADSEVLDPDFKEHLAKIARVVEPFVHCLNDMMTIQPANDDSGDDSDG